MKWWKICAVELSLEPMTMHDVNDEEIEENKEMLEDDEGTYVDVLYTECIILYSCNDSILCEAAVY